MSRPMHSRGPAPNSRYADDATDRGVTLVVEGSASGPKRSGSDRALVAVHDPRAHDDERVRGDVDSAQQVGLERATGHQPGGRDRAGSTSSSTADVYAAAAGRRCSAAYPGDGVDLVAQARGASGPAPAGHHAR